MTDLWTPSDDLLTKDPIAIQHIATPHIAAGLEQPGLQLPDVEDDAVNAAAAAFNVLQADGDDAPAAGESGECADDDEVADNDDHDPIDDHI
jgi:hypothetical protein